MNIKNNNMKAQTFRISGDKYLVEAISKKLREFGYIFSTPDSYEGGIASNYDRVSNIKDMKSLFIHKSYSADSTNYKERAFYLPEQYNEALEFAKEQLKDEYWRERLKYEDYGATSGDRVFKVVADNGGDKLPYTVKFKDGIVSPMGLNVRKATPEEIEEYNRVEFEVGALIGYPTLQATFKVYGKQADSYLVESKSGYKTTIVKKGAIAATKEQVKEFNKIDWKVGDIGTFHHVVVKITRIEGDKIYYQFKDGKSDWLSYNNLFKPTPEQIEEFNKPVYKAGDWIIWEQASIGDLFHKGEISKIELIHSNNTTFNVRVPAGWMGGFIFSENSIRHATPEEVKKANEPKDGDIVVSTGNKSGTCHLPIGTIGKVVVTKDKEWYYITEKNGEKSYNNGIQHLGSYFRKATKEEIAEFNKKPDFKSGAIVYSLLVNKVGTLAFAIGKYCVLDKNGDTIATDSLEYINKGIRYATEKEKEQFNKPEYVEMPLGSNNTRIKVYKDKIVVPHTGGKEINLGLWSRLLDNYLIEYNVGAYNANTDKTIRHIRIGCTSENNLVSLEDIKNVIDASNKL